MKINVIH